MARPEHVWELRPSEQLAAEDPVPSAVALAVPFPRLLGHAASDGFAGRRDQLTMLEERWQTSSSGRRCAVLVAGEPGIGKTRLAAEAAQAAYEKGAFVLYGRCDEDLAFHSSHSLRSSINWRRPQPGGWLITWARSLGSCCAFAADSAR